MTPYARPPGRHFGRGRGGVGAMLAVMAVVALVVYEKLGLTFLRRAWINSDPFWAGAFIAAGMVTLVT